MRTNSNRQGFSAVEGVIIVVIVVIIGALGYTFYNRMQAEPASGTPQTAAEAKAETSKVKTELEAVDIDKELDTSEIDSALEQ